MHCLKSPIDKEQILLSLSMIWTYIAANLSLFFVGQGEYSTNQYYSLALMSLIHHQETHTSHQLQRFVLFYQIHLEATLQWWRQGRARGGYSPPSEASSPPVGGNFGFLSQQNLAKLRSKSALSSHFSPPVRGSSPSVGRFLAPPLLHCLVLCFVDGCH